MFDTPLPLLLAIIGTFFVAGLVKGVTGMGLPTVAMGVLGALVSPLAAASLLIVPSLVTNLWQLLAGPAFGMLIWRLWPMMLSILIGTILGVSWLASGKSTTTVTALGMALVVYAAYTLFARQLHIPSVTEPWLSPLTGLVTGLIAGGTGVFVIPAVPYLQALGLPRDDLVQALGLSFTVSTIALAAGLGFHGAFSAENVGLSFGALVPALAGMWAGQRLRYRINLVMFRRVFLSFLLLLGLEMIVRVFR